jgi:hypothetical protein
MAGGGSTAQVVSDLAFGIFFYYINKISIRHHSIEEDFQQQNATGTLIFSDLLNLRIS